MNAVTDAGVFVRTGAAAPPETRAFYSEVVPGQNRYIPARARHLQAGVLQTIQLKPEINNKLNLLAISFINVYTYSNPKPTPYNNAKIVVIVVQ